MKQRRIDVDGSDPRTGLLPFASSVCIIRVRRRNPSPGNVENVPRLETCREGDSAKTCMLLLEDAIKVGLQFMAATIAAPTALDLSWSSVPDCVVSDDHRELKINRLPFSSYFVRCILSVIVCSRLTVPRLKSTRGNGAYLWAGSNQPDTNVVPYFEVTLKELASHRCVLCTSPSGASKLMWIHLRRFAIGIAEADFPARGMGVGGYQNSFGFTINGALTIAVG